MIYFLIYIGVALLFCFWDAVIGFGFEFEDNINYGPTAWLAAALWPVALPITLLYGFSKFMRRLKDWRLERAEEKRRKKREKERVRIAAQEEQQALLNQIEKELANETENLHRTQSR